MNTMPRFLRTDLARYAMIVVGYGLALALAMSIVSCASDRASLPPAARAEWDRLEAAQAAAEATPDPADDLEVEAEWAEFESRMAKEQASPFMALLPYGLGGIGLELVGIFASRRKRKLYSTALKNIGSGQIAAAVGDGLKAWGVQHSTPQPPQES